MRKPMDSKTQAMKQAIEDLFPGTMRAIEEKKCLLCKQPVEAFKSALSKKEYLVSGMCQNCQDKIFR